MEKRYIFISCNKRSRIIFYIFFHALVGVLQRLQCDVSSDGLCGKSTLATEGPTYLRVIQLNVGVIHLFNISEEMVNFCEKGT